MLKWLLNIMVVRGEESIKTLFEILNFWKHIFISSSFEASTIKQKWESEEGGSKMLKNYNNAPFNIPFKLIHIKR